jgi:hypothetical protein
MDKEKTLKKKSVITKGQSMLGYNAEFITEKNAYKYFRIWSTNRFVMKTLSFGKEITQKVFS